MSDVDIFLAHHGIKGMKWGVRRSRGGSSTSSGHPSGHVSEDFQRATAAQAKIKTGGTKALSNKELQDLVTRMNLERQYSSIQGPHLGVKAAKGTGKFVGNFILQVGKQQAAKAANDMIAKQVAEMFAKKA